MSEIPHAVNNGCGQHPGALILLVACAIRGDKHDRKKGRSGSMPQPMSAIASTELVRQKNSLSVMAALRLYRSLSHTDMSSFTGLASATVSVITTDLERTGLILRKEQIAAAGRGRPRILFAPNGAFCHVAIIIISSDSVQYSLVDYAGKLVDRFTEQRITAEKGSFGGSILSGLARLADRSRIDRHDILQVSISSKGLVDAAAAVLVWSPVLGTEKIDFQQLISQDGRIRVTLNNETLLAAKAIWMREQAKDGPKPEALVTLSLGHSIGLGIARSGASTIEVSAPISAICCISPMALCAVAAPEAVSRPIRASTPSYARLLKHRRRRSRQNSYLSQRWTRSPLQPAPARAWPASPSAPPALRSATAFRACSACMAICRSSSPEPAHVISIFWKAACATGLPNRRPSVSAACPKSPSPQRAGTGVRRPHGTRTFRRR